MPSRDEIYSAIRNADKAGDAASVQKLGAYLQTLPADPAPAAKTPAAPSLADKRAAFEKERYKDSAFTQAVGEPALKAVTGMAGAIAGGLRGVGDLVTGQGMDKAAADIQSTEKAMTREPRSAVGQAATRIAETPGRYLEKGTDIAGQKVADVTGSPMAGVATKVGLQLAPAVLLKAFGGESAAARGPASAAGKAASTAAQATTRAKDYVSRNTNLDWNALAEGTKKTLTEIAGDARNLDKLDPRAVERQARLASLPKPVEATRGQLSRDPVQLRNEGNVSATEAGKPIREIYQQQNKALLENLDVLKGKVRGKGAARGEAETPEQVGTSVQDTALRAKASASKANYDALYKKARETEPTAQVSADPLHEFLDQNPEVQHLGFLEGWLKKAKTEATQKTGGTTVTTRRGVSLAELDDLRKKASGIARAGGTDGYYAGRVVDAIDQSMSQIPAAAKAWKAAQQAFREHKTQFEEQGAVERLVTDKSRTDRSVALEDTWRKTVLGGSTEDLRNVQRSLLTGTEGATRLAGRKAWRDMRAQTIQHIKDEASKSVTRFEDGSPNVTPASMERAIKSIGEDKLEVIFGKGTVRQIKKIMEATRDVKTEPPTGFKGSPTFANVLAFLEKGLSKVPVLGDTVTGAVRGVAKLREMGQAGRDVRAAQETPLGAAAKDATKAAKKAKSRAHTLESIRKAGPASTITLGSRDSQ